MSILIVDDDEGIRKVLEMRLRSQGYDILTAENATEAYEFLGLDCGNGEINGIDLILMDILMPDIRGIDACKEIKSKDSVKDIPIILMTASSDDQHLEEAFEAGAMDYISKPFKKVELLARIRSALKLKSEIDQRKSREEELTVAAGELREVNIKLARLSAVDGLTEVFNRRYFDIALEKEFQRSIRNQVPISLIMIDIDGFKAFNDFYGHLHGDQCLKQIALTLKKIVNRSHDFIARYGGEEFVVLLPETSREGALRLAESLRLRVENLAIDHARALVGTSVSISLGVASLVPVQGTDPVELIHQADRALYLSKKAGRNRVTLASVE